MKKTLLACCFAISTVVAYGQTPRNATDQLKAIIKAVEDYEPLSPEEKEKYPLGAYREEDFRRSVEFAKEQMDYLSAIDDGALALTDKISWALLKYRLQEQIDRYEYKAYLNPILVDAGFHISFASTPSYHRFNTPKDYQNYIKKLKAFPTYVSQHIALMRRGIAIGMTQPKVILKGYEVTYDTHIVENLENSIFYAPFTSFPDHFSPKEKQTLLAAGQEAVQEGAIKGYQMVKGFFEKEYIPQAREEIGASSLPNGKAFYQNRADYYTTLGLSVKEIHQKGLEEVERIKREMLAVIKKSGFNGSFKEFIQFLRTDPQFYPDTGIELLKMASYHSKKADGQLPSLFKKLPRQPYGVAPVPDHLAPKYTGGRYSPAPLTSTQPGYYWVNTYNLKSRPLYVLESLTLHEAVPGHHLQMALTAELAHLPAFRNRMYISAFGEGWGLYAEWLGKEMGFYQDVYSDFGRLTYEMWRACRLVVDTGIHAFGWTRQQTIDYLAENTALSLHEVTTETDRYISWPGQALSYKIGELKIKELRKKAQKSLGNKFDVREFHDAVLSEGTVTLPLLALIIDGYIQKALK